MEQYTVKTKISTNDRYCGDYCLSMFNGDGEDYKNIYCGSFHDINGSHQLQFEGENLLRHNGCVEDCRTKKPIRSLNRKVIYDFMRKHKLKTIADLGRAINMSAGGLQHYFDKRNTFPQPKRLEELAEKLNVSVDDLII